MINENDFSNCFKYKKRIVIFAYLLIEQEISLLNLFGGVTCVCHIAIKSIYYQLASGKTCGAVTLYTAQMSFKATEQKYIACLFLTVIYQCQTILTYQQRRLRFPNKSKSDKVHRIIEFFYYAQHFNY